MILKTDEFGDEYYDYYDISQQQDGTMRFLSDFIHNFLETVALQSLIICLVFFTFIIIIWIFSHDICIPCVACFNTKDAWRYNVMLFFVCGFIRKAAYRVVRKYCKQDGIIIKYNDYKEKLRKFDEMANKLNEDDKDLIEHVLQSYKYKNDPYRMVVEREMRIRIKEKYRHKMKTEVKKPGILTKIIDKVKEKLNRKMQEKAPKRLKKKRAKKK